MKALVRRKLEMVARVREFSRAYVSTEPGYRPALAVLEEHLTRAQAIDARQHEGLKAVSAARARRVELRRVIQNQVARYLVPLGSLATKDMADVTSRFRIPDASLPNTAFVTTVKGLIGVARQHTGNLVELGMPAPLLDELTTIAADFESAADAMHKARRHHINAREDFEAICIDLMEIVKLIRGITNYCFGNDHEVMAEWRAARQIPRQARKVDSGRTTQPVTPPSDIRPAA